MMPSITRKINIEIRTINREELIRFAEREITKTGELDRLILDYEYGKGKIENVKILENTFEVDDDLTGKFKAGYDISEYSLCAAIDYTATHIMDISFEINSDSGQLLLTGENRFERSDEI